LIATSNILIEKALCAEHNLPELHCKLSHPNLKFPREENDITEKGIIGESIITIVYLPILTLRGILTSTALTLIVLPALYIIFGRKSASEV